MIGTGDLSELALGWCTYGVGDQMAHYNVNAGVPKTLIQHLIRWVISVRPVRWRGGGDAGGDPRHRDFARADPGRGGRGRRRAPRPRSGPTRCRISTCSTRCGTASAAQDRVPGAAGVGAMRRVAAGRRISRRSGAVPIRLADDPPVDGGVPAAGSSRSASSSGAPCRTGRRSSAGGSLSPRGDWRAPSDGNAARLAGGAGAERAGGRWIAPHRIPAAAAPLMRLHGRDEKWHDENRAAARPTDRKLRASLR